MSTLRHPQILEKTTQMSCRFLLPTLVTTALLLQAPVLSHATTPSEQALATAVAQWGQANVPNEPSLELAALDDRIIVPTCERALNIDAPFGQATNLRVRCPQPNWQLFVKTRSTLSLASETASAPAEVQPAEWVVVANQHLTRGTRLSPAMLSLRPADKKTPTNNALKTLEQAVDAELVRDVAAGNPLRRHDVRAAVLVKRGAMVLMSLGNNSALQITVRLQAQTDARMGEQVRLKNMESGREITAKVIGVNEAVAL
jgi:flagellar basal body P-ring formation protein FlgA|tara:strand:+ start:419 stop:1192 length:774 start_codon:yes stop_codon:yes gene_type:complete